MDKKNKVKEKTEKPMALALTNVEKLIETAVKSNAGIEQLQALMKMKYEHEAREAAKVFHEKFCSLQSELPVIRKDKSVERKDKTVIYKYAPLESIIKQILPSMQKYGFTYKWTESFEKDGFKRVTCHLTGHGHSESAYSDIPIPSATSMTNSIQQAGSASTYGKRYSLCGLLGIIADDDDDGRTEQKKEPEKPKVENKRAPPKVENKSASEINVSKNKLAKKAPNGVVRTDLQKTIIDLTVKMGAKSVEDARTITGVKSLDGTKLESLQDIRDRLRKEVDKKNKGDVTKPIENTKLPFDEKQGEGYSKENPDNDIFKDKAEGEK